MAVEAITVDVFGTAAFPSTPQIVFNFKPEEIGAHNLDDADSAQISFDGQNVHGTIPPGAGISYPRGTDGLTKVWLREVAGGSGTINIEVIAEG